MPYIEYTYSMKNLFEQEIWDFHRSPHSAPEGVELEETWETGGPRLFVEGG